MTFINFKIAKFNPLLHFNENFCYLQFTYLNLKIQT